MSTHTGLLPFCICLNKCEAPTGGQGTISLCEEGASYVWPAVWCVWNKPDTGINGKAMLCDRGYKVADKHWGAAYWAALKPVQNWREELCLTCRVSFWCCQLKRVRNITTAAAREVSEQKSDVSASLAVTSTWCVHFNEELWSCQRLPCLLQSMLRYFPAERCRKQLQREMFINLHWVHPSCQHAAQLLEWWL